MTVTMKDIARMAGVSVNTVSRALNDKAEISPETKERIVRLARQCDFTPNGVAVSLTSRRTRTVGLIVPDICDPFYAQQARGVEDEARSRGYTSILVNTDENPEAELQAIRTLRNKRVDGLLLTSAFPTARHVALLQQQNMPVVLLNRRLPSLRADYVVNDNVSGAYQATMHLIRSGHTVIAHITGPPVITSVQERIDGYRKAHEQAGLVVSDELIITGRSFKPDSGCDLARVALSRVPRPTAIFAFCDTLAIGAYAATREAGIPVPEQVAIVGYDDIPFASYFEVPLTTVAQPCYEMGRVACGILIGRIEERKDGQESEASEPKRVVFPARLVVRRSCGACSRDGASEGPA